MSLELKMLLVLRRRPLALSALYSGEGGDEFHKALAEAITFARADGPSCQIILTTSSNTREKEDDEEIKKVTGSTLSALSTDEGELTYDMKRLSSYCVILTITAK